MRSRVRLPSFPHQTFAFFAAMWQGFGLCPDLASLLCKSVIQ